MIEAFKSSDIEKCIDLGFDEGICNDRKEWYEAIIALLSYKQNKATIPGFYLMEKKDGRIVITHNGNVYKLVCNDSIKFAISTTTQTSKSQKQYKVASIIPLKDAEGLDVVKDLNPVCCGLVKDDTQKAFIALFNSSKSSRRVFNEVHYYPDGDPDITIGFGHFAEKTLPEYFQNMKTEYVRNAKNEKESVLNILIDFMLFLLYEYEIKDSYIISKESDESLYKNRNKYKEQIKKDLGAKTDNEKDIKDVLTKFFSEEKKDYTNWWKQTYNGELDENKKPKGKEILGGRELENIWFCDLLRYALLLEDVCKHQVTFWKSNVYKGAIDKAAHLGYYKRREDKSIDTDTNQPKELETALIAQLMSWKSSGWALYKGYKDSAGNIYNYYSKQMIDGEPEESDKYRLNDKGIINHTPTSNFNNEYKITKFLQYKDINNNNEEVIIQEQILVAKYDTKTNSKRDSKEIEKEEKKIKELIGNNNEYFDSLAVLLMWLSYNHFKDKIRPRQKAIWDLFLKDVWEWECNKMECNKKECIKKECNKKECNKIDYPRCIFDIVKHK